MNRDLINIFNAHEDQNRYRIKNRTIKDWLQYYNDAIDYYTNCKKCEGFGYYRKSKMEIDKLNNKISSMDDIPKEQFFDILNFSKNLVRRSLHEQIDCVCKPKIKYFKDCAQTLKGVADKEDLDLNYAWDLEASMFADYRSFRTHYVLSLLVKCETKLKDLRHCSALWIADYSLNRDMLFGMDKRDFIYLINTDIAVPNRDWLVANLHQKCEYLYTYKAKSKQERIL